MKTLYRNIYSEGQLNEIAQQILPEIALRGNVLFKGEVGAGKTTLIKTLVSLLGIDAEVTSPSFGLVNDYVGVGKIIHHFDLYRLESLQELLDIGWEEYLGSGNWLWVEWPENIPEAFDDQFLLLEIKKTEGVNERELTLYGF